ncbi:DUF4376 domain-containing protein [Desulfovibrio sp. OttesenSCG-928-C14]|nr:DUF4376 domain-containing protein [Desulfovibrio sp. OttesenSCG-928-C14]
MTTYYTEQNGKILAAAKWKFDAEALETQKEIVIGNDGWLYFAGDEPVPSLEEVKRQAKSDLREKRKAVEYGGFIFGGQTWDSTEKDELRLNSASKLFEAGIKTYDGWKISEGVYITLTPEILREVSLALMQHYGQAFAVEAAKLSEINSLRSITEVKTWLETRLNLGW